LAALVLSVLALLAGPLIYQWLQQGGLIARTLEHGIAVALAIILLLILLPDTWRSIGQIGLLLTLVGYLLPGIIEKVRHNLASSTHLITLVVAVFGLLLHSLLDGTGLAGSQLRSDTALPLVIIVHRLPVGIAIWLMLQPVAGRSITIVTLLVVSAATVMGYLLAGSLLPAANASTPYYIQALILGAVAHGLIHRPHLARHSH